MPENCPDYKNLHFILRVIWNFPKKQNPWILEAMEIMKDQKHVVHICNNKELKAFMKTLANHSLLMSRDLPTVQILEGAVEG